MRRFFVFYLTFAANFANMKRIHTWIITLLMGASFLVLLYLQIGYAVDMVRMRKEQFDESVVRSLEQASREVERNETYRYLKNVVEEHEALQSEQAPYFPSDSAMVGQVATVDSALEATGYYFRKMGRGLHRLPMNLTMALHNPWVGASNRFQMRVQKAYVYERELLDEVVLRVLYGAGDQTFQERLDSELLDNCLRNALIKNGITIPFHLVVFTSDGREVFRCSDYEEKGSEVSYTHTLFSKLSSRQMGCVQIHFPTRDKYILGIIRMVRPAIVFTVILFITFVVTVYLIARQKKLREMKNDFIHNMTHEFKTPISTISIAAQMLKDDSVKKSPEMYARLGEAVYTETRRLQLQVEKVLQISLFDNNNIALKLKPVDTNELVDNVVETFSLKVTQSGGSVEANLRAENPYVNVDEMHFMNIIFNLLDNALKYKRDDVGLRLQVDTWNQGDNLCLSIQDNGIGIAKENLKRIFEKFYRVHTGDKHNVKGFGLGLTYVKTMVELLHGSIKVSSELGQGTKFTLTIPNIKDQ